MMRLLVVMTTGLCIVLFIAVGCRPADAPVQTEQGGKICSHEGLDRTDVGGDAYGTCKLRLDVEIDPVESRVSDEVYVAATITNLGPGEVLIARMPSMDYRFAKGRNMGKFVGVLSPGRASRGPIQGRESRNDYEPIDNEYVRIEPEVPGIWLTGRETSVTFWYWFDNYKRAELAGPIDLDCTLLGRQLVPNSSGRYREVSFTLNTTARRQDATQPTEKKLP